MAKWRHARDAGRAPCPRKIRPNWMAWSVPSFTPRPNGPPRSADRPLRTLKCPGSRPAPAIRPDVARPDHRARLRPGPADLDTGRPGGVRSSSGPSHRRHSGCKAFSAGRGELSHSAFAFFDRRSGSTRARSRAGRRHDLGQERIEHTHGSNLASLRPVPAPRPAELLLQDDPMPQYTFSTAIRSAWMNGMFDSCWYAVDSLPTISLRAFRPPPFFDRRFRVHTRRRSLRAGRRLDPVKDLAKQHMVLNLAKLWHQLQPSAPNFMSRHTSMPWSSPFSRATRSVMSMKRIRFSCWIHGDFFPEALFQGLRQVHDPVDELEQPADVFRIHPAVVQPLDQPEFPGVPVGRRPSRLQGLQVGEHHHGERVRVGLQLLIVARSPAA